MRISSAIAVLACALTTVTALPASAHAQDDEADVRAVIDRMFAAMQAKDTTAFRATLHPEFRLVITTTRENQPLIRVIPVDDFVASIGRATVELEERIANVEIRIDDNVATVWNDYVFYVDGNQDHCGIDAFTLVRTADGWKVIHVADTQRQDRCPDIS